MNQYTRPGTMLNISRRKLLVPAIAVGGASLLPKHANADVAFTTFAFPATGAPSARIMPDRLGDVYNVKDFGAIGTGAGELLSTRYATLADARVHYPFVT